MKPAHSLLEPLAPLVYTRDDLDVERVLLYTIQPIEESA